MKIPKPLHICQCCGKDIQPEEKAVWVSYGKISKGGRFYCEKGVDVFHNGCDKSFREEIKNV